ncbi:MAG: hypothetical protein QME74_09245 [Candidatus Edwardsbacteria bacterium]|nr:hypothetical protein [Candidatus Edwardsbacteria bacterium]
MAIKPALREELRNSQRMLRSYQSQLAKLPRGSLVRRIVKGHGYYYLVMRVKGRVKVEYRGKASPQEILRYKDAKRKRAQYRNLISRLKKQIAYLKGTLRGRQAV